MTLRTGVMGGMFDPVHKGHISAAVAALNVLALNELRLIPCARPNHRRPAEATTEDRVAMLRLAIRDEERLIVDDREARRPGISYTVETLRSLRQEFEPVSLTLIVGEDAFRGLPAWHRWEEVLRLAHVCVINRPQSGPEMPYPDILQQEVRRRQAMQVAELHNSVAGRIYFLQKDGMDIASSELRQELKAGKRPSSLPGPVIDYIARNHLYT